MLQINMKSMKTPTKKEGKDINRKHSDQEKKSVGGGHSYSFATKKSKIKQWDDIFNLPNCGRVGEINTQCW